MRKRTDGEGKLIRVVGVPEKADDEVAGAHVVRQVGKVLVAEWIVADVLDNASAVRIRAGLFQLCRRKGWIAAEQQRNDGGVPGKVDQLLVRQHRVAISPGSEAGKTEDQRKRNVHAKTHSRVMLDVRKTHAPAGSGCRISRKGPSRRCREGGKRAPEGDASQGVR